MSGVRIGPTGVPPEFRTLGWQILDWQYAYLRQPDGPDAGTPWVYTDEQLRFFLWWYAVDELGRFVYRRGVFRRMKGHGKDPLAASLAATEFIGPCRFGGYDSNGMPVAIPHTSPWVQIAAVSKDQTRNTMTLFPGLFSPDAITEYGIDLGKEIIYARAGQARIEAVTSSPRTLEGGRASFVIKNETHHWIIGNEGLEMGKVIARNLAKSRDGAARSLAITNAHDPAEGSEAEADWEAYQAITQGRSIATGFLYDSLEADPDTSLVDTDSLRAGLIDARGDSNWLDVDRLIEEIHDPTTPPSMSRRFYLNQIIASEDSWLSPAEWGACADPRKILADKEAVTLGFDGSVRDDSTALVMCRVSDGHLMLLGCEQKPDGAAGDDWRVDQPYIDALVYQAFDRYNVVGFYADPPHWQDYLDKWTAEFGERLTVVASKQRPLEWWTNRLTAMVPALERFHEAVLGQQLTHDGDSVLSAHVLNARRRITRAGISIAKENPVSHRKIDAAMAAVLAYEARADAVAQGTLTPTKTRSKRLHRF